MIVTHNMIYLNTANKLTKDEKNRSESMRKISSGLKINRAGDNAAGSGISTSLKAKILSLSRAQVNVQEGLGVTGAVTKSLDNIVNDSLGRLKELSMGAANATSGPFDKQAQAAQGEIEQILKDIDSTATGTKYNGKNLLSPPLESISLQVGFRTEDTFKIDLFDATVENIGLSGINVLSKENALSAMDKIDKAIDMVSGYVSKAGAYETNLSYMSNSLSDYELKLTKSDSNIEDADVAKESLEFTQYNIITQATQALLVQANQSPESIIQLLK